METTNEWTSKRVKALRADLGLTLKEFGARCGVSLRTVQNWTLPECSINHRNPSGSACLILEQLEWEAKRNRGPIPNRESA